MLQRREATIYWHDPGPVLDALLELEGLEYILAVRDGKLPPDQFTEALGIGVAEAERGHVVTTARAGAAHMNLSGMAHGGMVATMLDCTAGYSVHTTLGKGVVSAHISGSYNFVRPVRAEVDLVCEGWVVRVGRRVGQARTELRDADGAVLATGQSSHVINTVSADG